jgi:hypothetical protein
MGMFPHSLSACQETIAAVSVGEWRWAIFSLGVAFVLLSIGLSALALSFLRRRTAGFCQSTLASL